MSLTKATYSMINGAPVNVLDYGAVGDGVADDTAAIQAAINANGGSVFFPTGTYVCSDTLRLPVYTFYDEEAGQIIYGAGAKIVLTTTNTLFSADVAVLPTAYTSKWTFTNLTFVSNVVGSAVFDMDRIYNSVFTECVFDGVTSPFYSHVDRSGDPNYPNGYIQSAIIKNNHFANCAYGVNAKRCFNLTVDANYFETCGAPVAVDGLGDPACNMIRITNNVMEGGTGTPIALGGVYGGLIQGNYFEANAGATSGDIKLNVASASAHRGLAIIANQFQPTTTQRNDAAWYNIRVANTVGQGRGPVVLGNVTSGPRLITGVQQLQILASGNFEGSGTNIIDQFPIPGQTQVKFGGLTTGFVDNRATAYSAGTWKVIAIDNVTRPTVFDINGFLNLYNTGGNILGVTAISLKVQTYIDAQNNLSAALLGTLSLNEIAGARDNSGNPLYTSYWGAVTPSFTISGSRVVINFDTFNDYSMPGLGGVFSLGPAVSVVASDGQLTFAPVSLSLP